MAYTAQEYIDLVKSDPVLQLMWEHKCYMGFPPHLRPAERFKFVEEELYRLYLIRDTLPIMPKE